MSDDFGSTFVTISDDDGNQYELEHLDTIEYGDDLYMAFLPTELDENGNQPTEMVILKVVEENGEEIFETIDDDELMEKVYEAFMEQLFNDDGDFDDE
ncbi:MAG: DUF1292 domain-containing protein [Oscillospiraceae bacterium]|jgi:uncharacterized FlaG/YvyC family protein|nr:DUF1292 domain-containing protein [Oscillospiraceae bacterium]